MSLKIKSLSVQTCPWTDGQPGETMASRGKSQMGRRCRKGEGEGHPALFPVHGMGMETVARGNPSRRPPH